ncbi:hypothetical protein Pint_22733 [Pistacia integerrima]|uniref:Uncharacterized protein n=1 Tax=Pistacia integerrima TaxID=434235 RepID=A0ACC0YI72_9ROSI|nr:hypothetical protein Pint_22733 [Pistacia integerrima]
MQKGGNPQAEAIFYHSQRLQDDLQMLGLKIKLHEDHIKLLKSQSNKLDDSILESQGENVKANSSYDKPCNLVARSNRWCPDS